MLYRVEKTSKIYTLYNTLCLAFLIKLKWYSVVQPHRQKDITSANTSFLSDKDCWFLDSRLYFDNISFQKLGASLKRILPYLADRTRNYSPFSTFYKLVCSQFAGATEKSISLFLASDINQSDIKNDCNINMM